MTEIKDEKTTKIFQGVNHQNQEELNKQLAGLIAEIFKNKGNPIANTKISNKNTICFIYIFYIINYKFFKKLV
jgi:hypothetical protein